MCVCVCVCGAYNKNTPLVWGALWSLELALPVCHVIAHRHGLHTGLPIPSPTEEQGDANQPGVGSEPGRRRRFSARGGFTSRDYIHNALTGDP